jgi:hypothetical protein
LPANTDYKFLGIKKEMYLFLWIQRSQLLHQLSYINGGLAETTNNQDNNSLQNIKPNVSLKKKLTFCLLCSTAVWNDTLHKTNN